jgi:hypothetical protein
MMYNIVYKVSKGKSWDLLECINTIENFNEHNKGHWESEGYEVELVSCVPFAK